MTTRSPTSAILTGFFVYAAVVVTTVASLAHAEPRSPATATTTVTQPPKSEEKSKATPRRATKADSPSKAKSAARPAKPAKKAPPTPNTGSNDKTTASLKPSQVMDFDPDQVEGQRLEPGFELIEGAPRKAQHRSLVEPLKPSDSVVGRQ